MKNISEEVAYGLNIGFTDKQLIDINVERFERVHNRFRVLKTRKMITTIS